MELRLRSFWELREACNSLIMPEPNEVREGLILCPNQTNREREKKKKYIYIYIYITKKSASDRKVTASGNEKIFGVCIYAQPIKIVTSLDKGARMFFASCIRII